ncbi:hypothetical protein DVDV_0138 [Desulfovibrio sp. DV]|uniref:hypothetical protein n=1 Tax=Desulfovibrio sp. DV TaxID=1844708 RepID=UPI00094B8F1C|nr:hypothetical protein [Desulfovibrio sp. DV]OLN31016.1 hypothetical protein DVDV_0138 [Desulfovibrio sp. DV]
MRVTGGYGGSGQPSSGGKDRSDPQAFRRGRRVGQIVRGRLVSPGPGGLFWVVVAGHKLLAALDHEPAPGRELVFRIEGLEPDLLLRDITPPPSAADDPVLLLAALTDARSKFEALLHRLPPVDAPPSDLPSDVFPGSSPEQAPGASAGEPDAAVTGSPAGTASGPLLDLTRARADFQALCHADPEAGQALARVRELVRLAGLVIPKAQGRPLYVPWIYPGLGQSEVLALRTATSWSLRLFGRLPEVGRLAAVFTLDASHAGYRLMLENPALADTVIASLARVRFGRRELAPVCLFAGGLPAEAASGFWARILAGAARPFTGLRLRV